MNTMPKKPHIPQEELDAFYEAMKGIKLLKKRKKIRLSRSDQRQPIKSRQFDESILTPNESLDIAEVRGEEFIAFKQVGVSNKTLRKLRKGQYNVEATLDLHGMTIDEAKTAVDTFLQHCLHHGIRVIVIIHGKGHHSQMPILKNKLNHWLRGINMVLAFCSASSAHGSRGAIYVLLKKEKLD